MSLPVIYRVKDAATYLDVTPAWLEKKAKQRIIPVRKLGGRYAWTEEDLLQIVEASLQESATPTVPKSRKPRTKTTTAPGPGTAPVLTARKRRR